MVTTPYTEFMMKLCRLLCFIGLFLFCAISFTSAALADQSKVAANVDNTAPAKTAKTNATPVYIEYEGTDTIGANLAFQLRERFNTSSLFLLTDKEQPKFVLLLRTEPEFECRPGAGSVYSLTWLYFEKKTTYNSYLQQELGVVTADTINATVTRVVDHTTGVAARYGSLLR